MKRIVFVLLISLLIISCKQNNAWKDAKNENTIETYQNYLTQFPEGKYVDSAKMVIDKLIQENAWKEAENENTIKAYIEYLTQFPDGKYANNAKIILDKLIIRYQDFKLGISRYEEVISILDNKINKGAVKKYDSYKGYYLNKKDVSTYGEYYKKSNAYNNYDSENRIKAISTYLPDNNYMLLCQMLFYNDTLYKLDLALNTAIIKTLKSELDNRYGEGGPLSYSDQGEDVVFGYTWGERREGYMRPIVMILATGIYSLSDRPPYYFTNIDNKIANDRYYINFYDRVLEEKFWNYIEGIKKQLAKK